MVLVFLAGVAWSADREFSAVQSATSDRITMYWNIDAAYWSCLTSQVESVVPPGTTVWASELSPNAPKSVRSLWKAVAGIRPLVVRRRDAGAKLFLVVAGKGNDCLGVKVKAVLLHHVVKYGTGTLPQVDTNWWDSHPTRRAP
jgi:hypothetical protein